MGIREIDQYINEAYSLLLDTCPTQLDFSRISKFVSEKIFLEERGTSFTFQVEKRRKILPFLAPATISRMSLNQLQLLHINKCALNAAQKTALEKAKAALEKAYYNS